MHYRSHSEKPEILRQKNHYESYWQLVSCGAWEPETFAIFDKYIEREHSYIDVGSWIGPTILYGAQLAKRAYGLEPDPVAYAELAANVALNPELSEKINIFSVCISDNSGTLRFGNRRNAGDSNSSLFFVDRKVTWEVLGMTFDDFIREYGITDCRFIKMDIEGGEYVVIPSMANYLKTNRPTLYLSLHPRFLRHIDGKKIWDKILRPFVRVAKTAKILQSLKSYKYIYDIHGRSMSPLRLLWSGFCGAFYEIIATDVPWA